jgi:hypothetical protein
MQPVAKQLQQLDYNNGNSSVFYVVCGILGISCQLRVEFSTGGREDRI